MKKEVVSVVRCKDYDRNRVRKALEQSLQNIGFHFKKNSKVLIKPNLLSAALPEKAITTHPVILEELCKILKSHGCQIFIGDSSAMETDKALKECGILKLSKYAKILNFESLDKKMFDFGEHMHRIPLPKLIFDVDVVINFAKLKTHGLTQVTLCTKNLYGCIPGEMKSELHKILPNAKDFSKLLVHLEKTIKPELNILDGIIGLEGEGPAAAGKPTKSKVIIASKNSFAADIIASRIMGFNPKAIYTNKISKLSEKEIQVIGDGKDVRLNFLKPKSSNIQALMFMMKLFPKPKITFDKKKCKQCHLCERKCPVKAISLKTKDKFPECNHKKCIHCLCCIEVCPYKSIFLKNHWSVRAIMFIGKKLIKY